MSKSPLFIEIALHYWCSPAPYDPDRMDAPAVKDVHSQLVDAGLLMILEGEYKCIHKPMEVYVNALGAVPLPKQVWTILS